ncbi:MAG TPA: hypothetical protein VN851_10170, partial [Thermoanaerobaculia bacterium]|nr:hypothetical protein [Thermoanaerobaculia bacterium]
PLMKSTFARRIRQWLLTLRKQNAAVVLVTQSLAQLYESPHRQVLLESCPTRILLPNPDAQGREAAALYADLGLQPGEIEILARARPKRDYYFVSPRGRRLFELGIGPAALAFLGTPEGMSLPETLRAVRTCRERAGELWPAAWLRDRGLPTAAERFERLSLDGGLSK